MEKYVAHRNEFTGSVQTVKAHCENTAELCREFSVPELKDFMFAVGLLHDIGKYQESFVKRINDANIRVEHSTCGALAACENYTTGPMALMMEYCITGHHSGIPDITNEMAYLTLDGENLVCKIDGEIKLRIPFENIENIVCFNYIGCSPALMGKCFFACNSD